MGPQSWIFHQGKETLRGLSLNKRKAKRNAMDN
jgi:hypothetical protein